MTGVSVMNFKRGDEPMKAERNCDIFISQMIKNLQKKNESVIINIKKEKFYDKPYAEMYRQIIRTGLECVQKSKTS